MDTRVVSEARILIDDVELTGVHTEIGHLGAYDLTIVTTVGPLAIDVQSAFVGHPAGEGVAAHAAVVPGHTDTSQRRTEPGHLADADARAARLVEHLAYVRDVIAKLHPGEIRVEIADSELTPPRRRR